MVGLHNEVDKFLWEARPSHSLPEVSPAKTVVRFAEVHHKIRPLLESVLDLLEPSFCASSTRELVHPFFVLAQIQLDPEV